MGGGESSFFVSGVGSGRIEIVKEAVTDRCHVALRVSNSERAVAALNAQGVELEEPRIKPGVKTAFPDAGYPYICRRGRYWIASARCAVSIRSELARSAMVRASFRTR